MRLRERKPVAFVFFRSGVLLIDRHGVLLDQLSQAQFIFPVLGGVREDETEDQRAEHVRDAGCSGRPWIPGERRFRN